MAVAVGRNVDDHVDVEAGTALNHRFGVLGDFLVQDIVGLIGGRLHRVPGTDADTSSAAHAFVVINGGLPVSDGDGVMGADFGTLAAADAVFLVHMGLAGTVLLHFSGPGAAAHADVFQSSAEAGGLMALEMRQGNEHIRVHHRLTDFGLLYIFAALHGNQRLVGAFQAVGNDHMTAGGEGGKSIFIGTFQMIQRIFPASHIQGVAVGEKWLAAQLFHHIRHRFGVIGAQVSQISRLAEVNFDGNVFFVKINGSDPRFFDQPFQFLRKADRVVGSQIGKIYF